MSGSVLIFGWTVPLSKDGLIPEEMHSALLLTHTRTAVSCIISLISASHIKHPVRWTELYKDSTANQPQHFYREAPPRSPFAPVSFSITLTHVGYFIFFLRCSELTSVFYLIPLAGSALFLLNRQSQGPFINVIPKPKYRNVCPLWMYIWHWAFL